MTKYNFQDSIIHSFGVITFSNGVFLYSPNLKLWSEKWKAQSFWDSQDIVIMYANLHPKIKRKLRETEIAYESGYSSKHGKYLNTRLYTGILAHALQLLSRVYCSPGQERRGGPTGRVSDPHEGYPRTQPHPMSTGFPQVTTYRYWQGLSENVMFQCIAKRVIFSQVIIYSWSTQSWGKI